MTYPSMKAIMAGLGETLRAEHGQDAWAQVLIIRAYMQSGRTHPQIDIALDTINKILNGHGVEALTDNGWDTYYCNCGVLYVNMGETYCSTVCYDTRKERWLISSWGDLVENDPKRFAG